MGTKRMRSVSWLVMLGFTAACGLAPSAGPAAGPSGPSGPEQTSAFETDVAELVYAQQSETEMARAAEATVQAAIAQTVAAAQPTGAPTFTLAPSSTSAPTATSTLSATSTAPAGDPANSLGNPDFTDNFNNDNNWSPYDSEGSKAEIKDGRFVFTKKTIQYGSHWTVSWAKLSDYYLQVTGQFPAACSGLDRLGIIFRSPDPNRGFLYTISCDGRYRLAVWDGAETRMLVDWTSSSLINSGANASNRLGILVEGKKTTLYINGQLLTSVSDDQYVGSYRFGLVVGAAEHEPFVVFFDDLSYWENP